MYWKGGLVSGMAVQAESWSGKVGRGQARQSLQGEAWGWLGVDVAGMEKVNGETETDDRSSGI